MMHAKMELEGRSTDVKALINLAVDQGILASVVFSNGSSERRRTRRTRSDAGRRFVRAPQPYTAGDRVNVKFFRAAYPVPRGQVGTVEEVKRSGKGWRVYVKWDQPQPRFTKYLPSTMLSPAR